MTRIQPMMGAAVALSLLYAGPANAQNFLTNGDFEDLSGLFPTGWAIDGAAPAMHAGLGGSASAAYFVQGNRLNQVLTGEDLSAQWTLDLLFAAGAPVASGDRTANLIINHAGGNLNMRVNDAGDLQVFDAGVAGFATLPGFESAIDFSIDADASGDFSTAGDTLNVHRLQIIADYTLSGSYDVSLSQANSTDLTLSRQGVRAWFGSAPLPGTIIERVSLSSSSGTATGPWVADEVSLNFEPPEPFTAGLSLEVDRETGEMRIRDRLGGTSIRGYSIQSPIGDLDRFGWDSLSSQGEPGWVEANDLLDFFELAEASLESPKIFTADETVDLGPAFFVRDLPFGESQATDLVFLYRLADGDVLPGTVDLVGPANNLVLTVNRSSGETTITNESEDTVEINGYSIGSTSGSLDADGWDSLDDQDGEADPTGWDEANPTEILLSELNLLQAIEIEPSDTISLGQLYNVLGNNDLSFDFRFVDGGILAGVVEYEGAVVVLDVGDMDGNGVVDAFDVDDFELALADPEAFMEAHPFIDADVVGDLDGSGSLDAFDVDEFEVLLASSESAGTVPEPGALALMSIGGLMTLVRRR